MGHAVGPAVTDVGGLTLADGESMSVPFLPDVRQLVAYSEFLKDVVGRTTKPGIGRDSGQS